MLMFLFGAAALGVVTLVLIGRFVPASSGTAPLLHIGIKRGFDLKAAPKQHGKVFLVTGATRGMGFETVVALAEKGATVVLGCRKAAEAEQVKDAVAKRVGHSEYALHGLVDLEMSSLQSVTDFVAAFKARGFALDCLILNAGIMHAPHRMSADNIEMHMAVNHFAGAALCFGLLDVLMKSAAPRVVVLSSLAHHSNVGGGIKLSLEEVNDPATYATRQHAYGQSKLANILFVRSLQKFVDATQRKKVWVNGVHPGGVVSDLLRYTLGSWLGADLSKRVQSLFLWGTADGALTQIACAIDPRVEKEDIRGQYWIPIARNCEAAASKYAHDAALADRFWRFTIDTLAASPAKDLLAFVQTARK